jgi:hypothetical protein
MNDPTVPQPSPNGTSAVDPTVTQPLANGNSAVTPNGNSAVTQRHLSRDERLRYRRRVDTQDTYNRKDSILSDSKVGSVDTSAPLASSCAAGAARDGKAVDGSNVGQDQYQEQEQDQKQNQPVVQNQPMVGYTRPKGVVTKLALPPPLPPAPKPTARPAGHQTKGERPLPPNWKCYPTVFVGQEHRRTRQLARWKAATL